MNGPAPMDNRHLDASEEDIFAAISARMDRLRETVSELRAGTISRWHAAHRIERIANEISRGRT